VQCQQGEDVEETHFLFRFLVGNASVYLAQRVSDLAAPTRNENIDAVLVLLNLKHVIFELLT
jgi:hypothetical protein